MHTHAHTHTYKCMHHTDLLLKYSNTPILIYIHPHPHTHTHTHTHYTCNTVTCPFAAATDMHVAPPYAQISVSAAAYLHVCMYACMYVYMYAIMRIHTYTYQKIHARFRKSLLPQHIHACIHACTVYNITHTCIVYIFHAANLHAYSHTHISPNRGTYIHTNPDKYTQIYTNTHRKTHRCTHTHPHRSLRASACPCSDANMRCVCLGSRIHMYAYANHKPIHTYMQAYLHTRIEA